MLFRSRTADVIDVIDMRQSFGVAMASGKRSALLSSLAEYGESEPDSDPEPDQIGISWF